MTDGLGQLLAKQEIYEVVVRYARAIDRLDEALLQSVFHPGSTHNHFYGGPSCEPDRAATDTDPGDFVRFAIPLLSTYVRTHHQLGNNLIELTSDTTALVETYFSGTNLIWFRIGSHFQQVILRRTYRHTRWQSQPTILRPVYRVMM